MFSWFSSAESQRFGKELAALVLAELAGSLRKHDAKFAGKAEKALLRADQRVAQFKSSHQLNFYQRAKLANAFLWQLRDGGCSAEYAQELTQWLSMRL
jgi:hypothetical protein